MIQPFFGEAEIVASSSEERYFPITGPNTNASYVATNTNGSRSDIKVPVAGTFRRLFVSGFRNTATGTTVTFTVVKNQVATALTVAVPGTGAIEKILDASNEVHCNAGDEVAVKYIASSSSGVPSIYWYAIEWEPDDGVSALYAVPLACSTLNAPQTLYYSPLLMDRYDRGITPVGIVESLIATAGTIRTTTGFLKSMLRNVFGDATAGSDATFTLFKNGVAQDGSGGTPDTTINVASGSSAEATTTVDLNFHVDAGDRLAWRWVFNSGERRVYGITFAFEPDITGQVSISTEGDYVTNAPTDAGIYGRKGVPVQYGQQWSFSRRMKLSGLRMDVQTAPGSGNSWEVQLWNGTYTAEVASLLKAIVVDPAQTGVDSVNEQEILEDDSVFYVVTPVSAPSDSSALNCRVAAILSPVAPLLRVTQYYVEVATDEDLDEDPPVAPGPCTGGGTVDTGENPAAGTALTTAQRPLAWMELTIPDSGSPPTVYRWAGVGIPHGEPKTARVLRFEPLVRALSDLDGQPESATMAIVLADTDLVLRGLRAAGTLRHAQVDVFVADLSTLQADGTPWRVFRGLVRDGQPDRDLTFRLEVDDVFSTRLNAIDADDLQVPRQLVTEDVLGAIPVEEMRDKAVPLIYGDIGRTGGAWELPYIGNAVLTGHEDLGALAWFLVGLGVIGVRAVYSGNLVFGTPVDRTQVAEALFGQTIFAPGHDGWLEANDWSERDGRRYTLVAGTPGSPAIRMAMDGRIPLVADVCGFDTVGDRSTSPAETIDSPARALLHLLNNFIVLESIGDWPALASFGDYSLFDADTFEAVHAYTDGLLSGGSYEVAGAVGGDFNASAWRDQVALFCGSFGFDFGINRHGQGMLTILDRQSVPGSLSGFTPAEILANSVTFAILQVENTIRYVYERNYVSTLPQLAPQPQSRLPNDPFSGDWYSGLQTITDDDSITALGGDPVGVRRSEVQEYELVRDQATADAVAAERLALLSPANGRAEVRFGLSLKHGAALELGDIIEVEHWDMPWTGPRRCQVRRLEWDLDALTVGVTARDVEDLLP